MLSSLPCRRVDIAVPMPLVETEAIVLRTYRLGEADKIVSLLTRQLGRLRAVAAGAQRPKSRYGASLEPLSYVRVWIFQRPNRDLSRLNSVDLLESFFQIQTDYRTQVATQYLAEVSERLLPEREVNERAFRLLLAVLRAFRQGGEVERPLLYYDYWVLRLAGFLPDLELCANCGGRIGEKGYYGEGSEGLRCIACRAPNTRETVARAALAYAETARGTPLGPWLVASQAPPGCEEARRFFEELIETHIERKLVTRPLLARAV